MSYPLDQVLLCACIEIDLMGWVSATKAFDTSMVSTTYWVKQHIIHAKLNLTQGRQDELVKKAKERGIDMFSSHYPDKVKSIIDWAKNITVGNSGYENRIKEIAFLDRIEVKDFGFTCSMVTQYDRSVVKGSSEHIGNVGDVVGVEGVLTFAKGFVDRFDRSTIGPIKQRFVLTLITDDGNIIKCWVSEDCANGFITGDRILVYGIIKEHGSYKDVKETTVGRVKLEKI